MRAVAFTMLAPGSGPEQRTRLAVQWRHISCEYSGWGSGRWGGHSVSDASGSAGRPKTELPGMPKAWFWETRAYPL